MKWLKVTLLGTAIALAVVGCIINHRGTVVLEGDRMSVQGESNAVRKTDFRLGSPP